MRAFIASLVCAAALLVAAVPAGASPVDGRASATPSVQPVRQTPVIHELHTVVRERDAGRTLSIVLAAAALLVATGTAAYGRRAIARVS